MADLNQVHSVLKMESIFFESISFRREQFEPEERDSKMELEVTEPEVDGERFYMRLNACIIGEGKYRLDISMRGVFSVDGGLTAENSYLKNNAAAIMFPFLRSEITLITSQPGITPVVLPPININAVMRKKK